MDHKCNHFHQVLCDVADACIPVSFVKQTPKDKPWITVKIKSMINARWDAFRSRNFSKYTHLKLKIRKEIQRAKASWTSRLASKNVWTAIHAHLGTRDKNPIDRLLSQFSSTDEAVEAINFAFSSNFQPKPPLHATKSQSSHEWKPLVHHTSVLNLLMKLDVKKSSFDIPNLLYKEAAPIIVDALTHLFQASVEQRKVPNIWKISAVTPIPKCSRPTLQDLRPISLLSTPFLEIIVLRSDIQQFFMNNFDANQFGFRPRSSTLCALISLDEYVSKHLDNISTAGVAVVSYDLSKAFDKLPHCRIIERLVQLNFPNNFIEWVSSYLDQRQQFVRIGIHSSQPSAVTSGVPQGSVLGPILFVNTISSYPCLPEFPVFKYADDTTLCFPIDKQNSHLSIQAIHSANERITAWSKDIGLPINLNKSKCLTIKKSDSCPTPDIPNVQTVEVLRILGVFFNSKWNFDNHVAEIVSTSSRRLYAMRILRPFLSKNQLILLYNAFVRSYIEYCAPLFLHLSVRNSKRLGCLQNRFHRLICGKQCSEDCLTNLEDRRSMLSLKLLKSIMNRDHILHSLLPPTLPSGRFCLPFRRTEKRCNSFFPLVCEMFNITLNPR